MFFNPVDIKEAFCHINPHDHFCLAYKTQEEWRAAVIPFLNAGLIRGDKCLYLINDSHTAGQIRQYLTEEEIDVAAAEASGQLEILQTAGVYTNDSFTCPGGIINLLINETNKAIAGGYPLLRVTGEMLIPKNHLDSKKLLEYEARLNRDFFPGYPCAALCQYNRNKYAPEIIIEALKTHPLLVKGDRVHQNFYYIPPEEYLDPKSIDNEVDYLLDSLEHGNHSKVAGRQSHRKYHFTTMAQQLQDIIEFLPDATFAVDQNKKVIAWNQAIEEMTGIRKEDIIGKGDFAYAIPLYGKKRPFLIDLILSDYPEIEQQYDCFERKGKTIYAEGFVPFPFKDKGAFIWGKASPLLDSSGNLIGAIESFRDITKHKQIEYELRKHRDHLEKIVKERTNELTLANEQLRREITERKLIEDALRESEKKYRVLYEQANDAIFLIKKSIIIDCNPRALYMFGCRLDEIIGKTPFDYAPSTQPCGAKSRIKAIGKVISVLRGKQQFFEFQFRRQDGTTFMTEVSLSKLKIHDDNMLLAIIRDITGRKQAEEALQESEKRYRQIVETAYEGIWVIDTEGRTTFANKRMAEMLGYTVEEMVGQPLSTFMYEDYKSFENERLTIIDPFSEQKMNKLFYRQYDLRYRRKDGKELYVIMSVSPLFNIDGSYAGSLGMVTDINERKRAEVELKNSNEELAMANEELIAINEELLSTEEELKQQFEKLQASEGALASANRRLQGIIEFLPDATFVIDNEKKVIAWNQAIEKMTGVPKEEILGKGDCSYAIPFYGKPHPILIDFALITPDEDAAAHYDSFKKEGHFVHGSTFVPKLYGGKGAYLWGIASPLFDREGNLAGAIESIRDITEQRQLENRLKYLGMHDSLTGLHNRAYFEEEMRRLDEESEASAGIIVCDVDGLKLVNDTLGHETGDMLLIAAAGVIKDSFREGDMVARIGGDEFAVILPNNENKFMENACNRIIESVERHNAAKPELPLSISTGFAARSDASTSMSDLFKEADNKMYREKLHRNQSARSAIVQTLMKALEARDFITEEHAERIQNLVAGLAAAIDLSERSITDLRLLAQFHDIGKIGIPDSILLKPDPLTSEEVIEMRQHCEIGHRIAMLSPDLAPIADWILKHHEWWNGLGYPLGIKGVEIPLECRILAIADAYDAMTSDRPYRKAMPHKEALAELKKYAGTQFDPYLVEKFVQLHNNR